MYNYTCANCGAPVTYRRKVDTPRCKACRAVEKKRNNTEYQRRWQRDHYHKRNPAAAERLPKRHWANGVMPLKSWLPTRVVGISPSVKDAEQRWYLAVYLGSTWPTAEFVASAAEAECFDGLLVEHNGSRYAVVGGQLEVMG